MSRGQSSDEPFNVDVMVLDGDGLEFEQNFMQEVELFKDAANGVDGDLILAALIAKREHREEIRQLLHQRKLRPVETIDDDDDWSYDPESRRIILLQAA